MRVPFYALFMLCATVTAAQHTWPDTLSDVRSDPTLITDTPRLVLYPNPTPGTIRVNWEGRALFRMPVEVRTWEGQLLRMDSLSPENELDVSTLPDGLYRLYLLDLTGVRAVGTFRVMH